MSNLFYIEGGVVYSDIYNSDSGESTVVFTYSGTADLDSVTGTVAFKSGGGSYDLNFNLHFDIYGTVVTISYSFFI